MKQRYDAIFANKSIGIAAKADCLTRLVRVGKHALRGIVSGERTRRAPVQVIAGAVLVGDSRAIRHLFGCSCSSAQASTDRDRRSLSGAGKVIKRRQAASLRRVLAALHFGWS